MDSLKLYIEVTVDSSNVPAMLDAIKGLQCLLLAVRKLNPAVTNTVLRYKKDASMVSSTNLNEFCELVQIAKAESAAAGK